MNILLNASTIKTQSDFNIIENFCNIVINL